MKMMKNIVQWFRKETKVFEGKKRSYCESENHFRGNKDTSCCFNGEENTIGKVSPAVHSFSIKYKEKQKGTKKWVRSSVKTQQQKIFTMKCYIWHLRTLFHKSKKITTRNKITNN